MLGMNDADVYPSLRTTRAATAVACIFFLPAAALSPGAGSSLGIPSPEFFCTWGVVLLAAFVSLIGYLGCKLRRESISSFYAICPALLFIAFLVLANRATIARW